jgi:hypothetical protein
VSWTLFLVLVGVLVLGVLGIVVVSSLLGEPHDDPDSRQRLTARAKRAGGENLLPTDPESQDVADAHGADGMELGPTD